MAHPSDAGRWPSADLPAGVVFHHCRPGSGPAGHDQTTKRAVARSIAELLDLPFVGDLDVLNPLPGALMVVPTDTIEGVVEAQRLGIDRPDRFFGGVVPHAFVATKAITHPLVHEAASAPTGWSHVFGEAVAGVVLPGYTAFDRDAVLLAGRRLLADGSVRVKDPAGVGGSGQHVIKSIEELAALLEGIEPARLRDGLVLERNLQQVTTYSVGLVQVGPWHIAYCGTQSLTRNHHGAQVYGGSSLTVARGDETALLALPLDGPQRAAVGQAMVYHHAAFRSFPGLMASRCNYDVACGVDDAGSPQAGVLEQSWRIGGASGAELAAMHAFRADPAARCVRASSVEIYGEPEGVPADAHVHYDGIDAHVGRLVKYAMAEPIREPHADT